MFRRIIIYFASTCSTPTSCQTSSQVKDKVLQIYFASVYVCLYTVTWPTLDENKCKLSSEISTNVTIVCSTFPHSTLGSGLLEFCTLDFSFSFWRFPTPPCATARSWGSTTSVCTLNLMFFGLTHSNLYQPPSSVWFALVPLLGLHLYRFWSLCFCRLGSALCSQWLGCCPNRVLWQCQWSVLVPSH